MSTEDPKPRENTPEDQEQMTVTPQEMMAYAIHLHAHLSGRRKDKPGWPVNWLQRYRQDN